jgi:L-aminopeptidase/D-esterase-like protein
MANLLTDIPGVAVGQVTDLARGSGVTAILFDQPAVAAVAVLGGAPGGRELGLLDLEATVQRIDAIVLSGGSTFGLDAAAGVQAALRESGRAAFAHGGTFIPLVAQAILFDLASGGDKDWGRFAPYREMGYSAARGAVADGLALGSVGAGTGATTATVKGGLGSASAQTAAGHTVAAIVAVNAVGAPTLGGGPWFWSAPYEQAGEFGNRGWPARLPSDAGLLRVKTTGASDVAIPGTTIGAVVTDAALTKPQARRLAIMANNGLARAVLPSNAPLDGDTIFAASTGARPLHDHNAELTALGHAATLVMARAIARGVYEATTLPFPGAQPCWRDRFGA